MQEDYVNIFKKEEKKKIKGITNQFSNNKKHERHEYINYIIISVSMFNNRKRRRKKK